MDWLIIFKNVIRKKKTHKGLINQFKYSVQDGTHSWFKSINTKLDQVIEHFNIFVFI